MPALLRRVVSWCAVLAVTGLAGQARGSCGDYLVHEAAAAPVPMLLDVAGGFDSASAPEAPVERCSGPHCRQSPHVPDPPAAPIYLTSGVEQALLSDDSTDRRSAASDPLFDTDCAPLPGFHALPERPPRCG